jgi:hypothetical protein
MGFARFVASTRLKKQESSLQITCRAAFAVARGWKLSHFQPTGKLWQVVAPLDNQDERRILLLVVKSSKSGLCPSSSHTVGPMLAAYPPVPLRLVFFTVLWPDGAGPGTDRAVILGLHGEHPGVAESTNWVHWARQWASLQPDSERPICEAYVFLSEGYFCNSRNQGRL